MNTIVKGSPLKQLLIKWSQCIHDPRPHTEEFHPGLFLSDIDLHLGRDSFPGEIAAGSVPTETCSPISRVGQGSWCPAQPADKPTAISKQPQDNNHKHGQRGHLLLEHSLHKVLSSFSTLQ